ncbi:hypothetical protein Bpfe_006272, partial [Biomphalaria pfeifferi]
QSVAKTETYIFVLRNIADFADCIPAVGYPHSAARKPLLSTSRITSPKSGMICKFLMDFSPS